MIKQTAAPVIETPLGEKIYELLGHETGADAPKHSIARVKIVPGGMSLRHYHPVVEESYWITAGNGTLEVGEETMEVAAGDMIQIPIGSPHKISNTGSEVLEMTVFCAPAWTPDCSVFLEGPDA